VKATDEPRSHEEHEAVLSKSKPDGHTRAEECEAEDNRFVLFVASWFTFFRLAPMNPVLQKDLLGLLRLKRVAAIHLVFIGVLSALVLATWPQQGIVAVAAQGRDALLLGLVVGQLMLLVLIVPGVAAVSIVGEREANTLEMLYASRLSAAQIIVGKVLSSLGVPLLLLATGLPFAALLGYRGELDAGKLALCYGVLLAGAVLLSIGSLTISAVCTQTASALVVSYVTTLIVCGGLLVPAMIMLKSQSGLPAQATHYARALSPVAAALSILRPDVDELGGREPIAAASEPAAAAGDDEQPTRLLPAWKVFFPLAGVVIAACFGTLVSRLSRAPTAAEGFADPAAAARSPAAARARMLLLARIDTQKPRGPMSAVNPLLSKEARTSQLRSGRWMFRTFYAALALSLLLAVMALYGGVDHPDLLAYVARVIVALQAALIALVVPSLTSAAISAEVETGTFEMLRLTPMRSGAIFWGKFLPALPPALLPIAALIPAFGTIAFIDAGYIPFFGRLAIVIVTSVATCATVGLTCSAFAGSTPRATVVSYLLVASLFALPLLAWWAGSAHLSPEVTRWLAMPSPLVIGLNLLPGDAASPLIGELWQVHVITMLALCGVLLIASRLRLTHLLRHG
jgi:ABC-type transport system involved in multi-copper enzyme maturation permease subunit